MKKHYSFQQKLILPFTLNVVCILAFCLSSQAQGIRYVDANAGNDGNNGLSWITAYKTLSKALNIARTDNSVSSVLVAAGTYYPAGDIITTNSNLDSAFTILRGGLQLYGGYNATTGLRDTANNHVYLDGNSKSHHVMVIASLTNNSDSVVVDGFTLRNGNANASGAINYNGINIYQGAGGGLYVGFNANNYRVAVRNCIFSANISTYSFYGGGGMYVESSSPSIANCTFIGNSAMGDDGGAIHNVASSPLITNCIFSGNTSFSRGGGIANRNASPIIINCLFSGNSAQFGGGGGLDIYAGSSPQIINCTFFGNRSRYGGGIQDDNNQDAAKVTNCIIYGNLATTGDGSNSISAIQLAVSNSLVEGGYTGTNNFNTNPLFINTPNSAATAPFTGGNYRLQSNSPAIDMGSNGDYTSSGGTLLTDLDLSKNPRLSGTTIDMGAYEYQKASVLPVILLSFTGALKNDKTATLNWQVAMQINEKQYVLERSSNNIDFITIGSIAANQSFSSTYNFKDESPLSGLSFYRLKMIDLDGNIKYGPIISLSNNYQQQISLYPLPAYKSVTLQGDKLLIGQKIRLINLAGMELTKFTIIQLPQILNISQFSAGTYWLQTNDGQTTKLIIEKN